MNGPRLLITRPDDEAGRTADAVRAAGFTPLLAPLLAIEALAFTLPAQQPDAILFTSPRAPALLAAVAPALRACPVYSVGPRTTEAAAAAGFTIAAEGQSDGNEILRLVEAQHSHILHPRGEDHIDLTVPAAISLLPVAVYRARPVQQLPAEIAQQLAAGDVLATLLFSPRTARIFADLAAEAGLQPRKLRLVALSANVREAVGGGWGAIEVATAPRLDEAMAAARRLWHGLQHA